MKRFVLQQLIEWKNREDRKPLILNGLDKLGKHGCSMSLPNLNTKRGLCGMP